MGSDELAQYLGLPIFRTLQVPQRIERRRRLRQPREQRRLPPRERPRCAREVTAAGTLDPVEAVTEVDRVQVHREDLLLRVGVLELERERDGLKRVDERSRLLGIE